MPSTSTVARRIIGARRIRRIIWATTMIMVVVTITVARRIIWARRIRRIIWATAIMWPTRMIMIVVIVARSRWTR